MGRRHGDEAGKSYPGSESRMRTVSSKSWLSRWTWNRITQVVETDGVVGIFPRGKFPRPREFHLPLAPG